MFDKDIMGECQGVIYKIRDRGGGVTWCQDAVGPMWWKHTWGAWVGNNYTGQRYGGPMGQRYGGPMEIHAVGDFCGKLERAVRMLVRSMAGNATDV